MNLEFLGAARTVTGSKHLIRTDRATILLDCGLFQGRRQEALGKNLALPIDPEELDAVVLSHAHLDHSGALPVLVAKGYRGPIYATPATRSLCACMLADSAHIQEADARYVNKLRDREGEERVTPLYGERDVMQTLSQMTGVPYRLPQTIAPGVRLTFLDAGHVLGSAIVVLDIEEKIGRSRLVFSGDLGRKGAPLLRDPEIPEHTTSLILESTYGDRVHPPMANRAEELAQVLQRTHARGGKVLIPAFALERAQEVLYSLHELWQQGRLPKMPIFVDSPLTAKVTDVFRMNLDCLDEAARARFRGQDTPLHFPDLVYVADKRESQALDAMVGPAVIISASGMCEGGRVVHHLKAMLGDARNTVAIVGFQAQHTLGRRLVEGNPRVRIFGVMRERRAEVVVLEDFSAHADQGDLVEFATAVKSRGALRDIFLVHGELPAQEALREQLHAAGLPQVEIPAPGQICSAEPRLHAAS